MGGGGGQVELLRFKGFKAFWCSGLCSWGGGGGSALRWSLAFRDMSLYAETSHKNMPQNPLVVHTQPLEQPTRILRPLCYCNDIEWAQAQIP